MVSSPKQTKIEDKPQWTKKIVKQGDGKTFPVLGDVIVMDYTGKLENGNVFDSSKAEGRSPIKGTIGVGRFIRGWDEEYGYGKKGFGKVIPPNSTLIFDVELLEINPTF
ncbi:FK506 binding protein proline rotamase rapamycin-binding protein [Boothiomyces sp. JEL0838]|nr:FK506 binding protein proline rotamase rapamycin-binding protein [Boothiomyces sp. JEL0838]